MKRRELFASLAVAVTAPACLHQQLFRAELDADGATVVPRAQLDALGPSEAVVVRVPEAEAVVRRVGSAFVAVDPTCTHRNCAVTVAPDGYDCACHGSRFAPDGAVRGGPATMPLRRFSTTLTRDGLRIVLAARGGG